MKRILVLGAGGQIGSELVPYLRSIYGADNVLATDVKHNAVLAEAGPFEALDALDAKAYAELVNKYKIDSIFNLVALLSATGEKNPQLAMRINMGALENSLEIAREKNCAVFTPSSIGAFGGDFPRDKTPQDTVMQPNALLLELTLKAEVADILANLLAAKHTNDVLTRKDCDKQ